MRRLIAVTVASAAFVAVAPTGALAAANPSPTGTGPPSQSCQDITAAGGTEPGNAVSSPGSPFNEPTLTTPGGTGGLNYSPKSQYDVACYQVSQPHS